MQIAVFSDSHGHADGMLAAVEQYAPHRVIFLGDGCRDAEQVLARFPHIPFHILRGNCDLAADYEDSLLLELDGVRIFAAHGHNHHVKLGLHSFANSTWCAGAALGLYGHTHRPLWQERRGVQLLNPGSAGDPLHPTFAIVSIENASVHCRILDIST